MDTNTYLCVMAATFLASKLNKRIAEPMVPVVSGILDLLPVTGGGCPMRGHIYG